jgi:hypothetical protein
VNYYKKKFFQSLRTDKQPLAILSKEVISAIKDRNSEGTDNKKILLKDIPLQTDVLKIHIQNLSSLEDSSIIQSNFRELKKNVDYLIAHNVEVIFFKMPVHQQIDSTPVYHYIERNYERYFPANQYDYMPRKDFHFTTGDGLHLGNREAIDYTLFLKKFDAHFQPSAKTRQALKHELEKTHKANENSFSESF